MSGLFLIALGVVLLGFNLYGLSFLRRASVVFEWLSLYWPVLLVLWGSYKIVERLRSPERAHVSALEVVALVFFVLVGLTLSAGRRGMERLARDGELQELVDVIGPELLGPRHELAETESFPLSAEGPRRLLVENPRGAVSVTGWSEDRIEVALVKRLHAPSEEEARAIADGVAIELSPGDASGEETEEGARYRLAVRAAREHERRRTIETELSLRVPRDVAVEVRTRRGRIELSALEADARLRTSEAPIEVTGVSGSVYARTDRGAIHLTGIGGNVDASTRSGDLRARGIEGNLEATTSRAILVAEDVSGDSILSSRRGSLRVSRAGGSVTVDGYQSALSIDSVGADLVADVTRGSLFVRNAEAKVSVRARRATIQLSDVRGDLVVEGSDSPTTLTGIRGSVRVASSQSDVQAFDLASSAVIENADDVDVRDFAADLTVTSRHGDIDARTSALAGRVSLDSSYGDVALTLPEAASARLEARTEDGALESTLPGFGGDADEEGSERRWSGLLGAGAHEVTLVSEHGDIVFSLGEGEP